MVCDIFCREKTGFVLLRSVEAALIVLSGDTLPAKHRGLNHVYKMYLHFTRVNWFICYIITNSYI